jgi:diguanylate cyclase (GGDEF)-like protein
MATLSTQLGNRLGALRALESSRAEAATDKLTGLPNRRMLESQIGALIERGTPFVLVLADLDKFKRLNDTYGHEVGDRALQTFAQVLRDKVRGNDVISRLGGEEFVLVYPNMSVTTSIEAIERIRDGLTQALAVSALPEFTCSFGITHSAVARSGDAIIRVADAGLLRAKELGGDQVVYADESLAAQMFGDEGRA